MQVIPRISSNHRLQIIRSEPILHLEELAITLILGVYSNLLHHRSLRVFPFIIHTADEHPHRFKISGVVDASLSCLFLICQLYIIAKLIHHL